MSDKMSDKYGDHILAVDTFKSGRFYFSSRYDETSLSKVLITAEILMMTIRDLPILPDLASQFDDDLLRRSIFGTAKIEGNPLSEEEVGNLLKTKASTITTTSAEKEIENLKETYEYLESLPSMKGPFLLKEEVIKHAHKLITSEIEYDGNNPGSYRHHRVEVSDEAHGGKDVPPRIIEDIEKLMKEFVSWMNSERVLNMDRILRANLAHYYLCLIHPFGDGNGRTARVIEAIMLRNSGFKHVDRLLPSYYAMRVDDYYLAFSKTRKDKKKEITPFFSFCLDAVIASLNEIKNRIVSFINKFALRDYYASMKKKGDLITRQHKLLLLLLEHDIVFKLEDVYEKQPLKLLYENVNIRTARRDLDKLLKMNLLLKQDKEFSLNLYTLQERSYY